MVRHKTSPTPVGLTPGDLSRGINEHVTKRLMLFESTNSTLYHDRSHLICCQRLSYIRFYSRNWYPFQKVHVNLYFWLHIFSLTRHLLHQRLSFLHEWKAHATSCYYSIVLHQDTFDVKFLSRWLKVARPHS